MKKSAVTGFTPTPIGSIQSEVPNWCGGFTLLELTIVIVIVGVLATLGLTRYGSYKETGVDKEAKANLKLLLAAQRIYRIETGGYYPLAGGTISNMADVNTNLRLLLSQAANRNWNYLTTANNTAVPAASCAQATRVNGPNSRTWRMRRSEDTPVSGGTCP